MNFFSLYRNGSIEPDDGTYSSRPLGSAVISTQRCRAAISEELLHVNETARMSLGWKSQGLRQLRLTDFGAQHVFGTLLSSELLTEWSKY